MSSYQVKPATRGSAAMTLVGLTGEEVAHPCEPYRTGCRGHWAAIHSLRVRLEVATPCPTWSLRSSKAALARSCHMGDPNRSIWTRKRWFSRKARHPPQNSPFKWKGQRWQERGGSAPLKGVTSSRWSQRPGTRLMQASFTSNQARHELEEALPGTQGQD